MGSFPGSTIKYPSDPAAIIARIRTRVEETDDGCWIWQGSPNRAGYGQIMMRRVPTMVHRAMFMASVGPIPDGLELDHLCNNRACCNPAHLEAVTHAENCRRGAARRTHCKNGHPYGDHSFKNGGLSRRCNHCRREGRIRRIEAANVAN